MTLVFGMEKPWSPATDVLGLAVRPGRRSVVAPAGVLQRRPARAHARRRRIRTTRAGARPSEDREDDERHAAERFRRKMRWKFSFCTASQDFWERPLRAVARG